MLTRRQGDYISVSADWIWERRTNTTDFAGRIRSDKLTKLHGLMRRRLSSGRKRTLKLDASIAAREIENDRRRWIVLDWMERASAEFSLNQRDCQGHAQACSVEVRQGYKSKVAKPHNADMANAAEAYTQGYQPILILMSSQIDGDIVDQYERIVNGWYCKEGWVTTPLRPHLRS